MLQFPLIGVFLSNALSWTLCWPYVAGAVTLIIGVLGFKKDFSGAQGLDRITLLTPFFVAVPMAIFGADHFVFHDFVARIVPSWIPWHLFWALFVGVCLIAGGLGIAVRRYEFPAMALFGTMMYLFVLLMHIPSIVHFPKDRLAWTIFFRDLTFGTGALCFAAAHAPARWTRAAKIFLVLAPLEIGIASIFFAAQHFLHPVFMPGIPFENMTPQWVPLRITVAYLTGVVLLISGLAMLWKKWTQAAAIALGIALCLLTIVLYVPLTIVQPIETGLNYFGDTLMFSGIVLCLAGSYRCSQPHTASEKGQRSRNGLRELEGEVQDHASLNG
jgi:uncharacterized membrane protein